MMNEHMEDSLIELEEDALELVSGGKTRTMVVKGSEVNVRSGPGKDYGINGRLHKGDKVTYLNDRKKDKEGKTWVYVSNGRLNGWIRTDLIK